MNSLIYLVGGVTTEVKAFIKSGPAVLTPFLIALPSFVCVLTSNLDCLTSNDNDNDCGHIVTGYERSGTVFRAFKKYCVRSVTI